MKIIHLNELYSADYNLQGITPHYHFWKTAGRWSTPPDGRIASGLMYLIGCEAFYYKNDRLFLHAVPGDIIYLPKNAVYTCIFSRIDFNDKQNLLQKQFNAINVRFDLTFAQGECFVLNNEPFIIKGFSNAFSHFKSLADMWIDVKTTPSNLKIRLYQLLNELSLHSTLMPDSKKYTCVLKALKLMNTTSLKDLSVQKLAEYSTLSASRFRALFTEYTGISPVKYIERLKADKAYELLKSGEMTVSDVALTLGINDPAYFSRFYKKITGRKPTDDLKQSISSIKQVHKP